MAEVDGEKVLIPVQVEANLDPFEVAKGLAVGVLAVGAAAVAGVVAWHGLDIPAPLGGAIELVPGIKDTGLGKDISRAYERWALRWRIRVSGGQVRESRTGLSSEEIETVIAEQIGDTECQLLNREWAKAKRRGDAENAANFLRMAREQGCPWVNQI